MKKIILFIICSIGFLVANAQTNIWTGASSTDWHSGCNWSLGHVPTCTENVRIPTGMPNNPTITGVASCLTIDIQGVASTLLTINTGATLQVDQCPVANTVNASGKIVFVTSITMDANTSVATRDARCATEATAAGLTGTYKAWVSNGAANNIPSSGGACGYKKPDGTVVATSWADLTDGTLASAINMLANGTGGISDWVYTGISSNGNVSGSDCSGWTNWNTNGTYGLSSSTTSTWTAFGSNSCGSQSTTTNFNCGGGNQHFIGVNALDNCTCWAGTALDACTANIGSVSGPSHDCAGGWNCAAPCTINFSYCWCCLVTGTTTTTNYTDRRHYCFQQ